MLTAVIFDFESLHSNDYADLKPEADKLKKSKCEDANL